MKSQLKQAIQYHQNGEFNEAETIYRNILSQDDQAADVWHLLGILLAQKQEFSAAKTALEKAIALDPDNYSYENSLGNVYKKLGEYSHARQHYERALTLNPDYAIALHNLAAMAYQEQDYEAAEQYYRRALTINLNYVDAHYHLATVLAKQQRIAEAIEHYQAALNLQPQHAEAHYHLGQILQTQQRWDEAQLHYQECLAQDPDHPSAHHNLGTVLVKKGEFEQAIEHFERTLAIEPNHQEALSNLGTTYLLMNKLDQALKYFLQLLQFQSDAELYYNIGTIFMQMDRHNDAIIHLNEALRLRPDHIETLLNLGAAYLKKEDYKNAINVYRHAANLKPDDAEINYILQALEQKGLPNAAPAEYLQHLFDQYAPYFEKHLHFLNYQVPKQLAAIIKKNLPKSDQLSILDLGCGTGLVGEQLASIAHTLIGIDISNKMVELAKAKNIYTEVAVMDIETALHQYQAMNIIVAGDVFTYIGNLENIFKLAKIALANDGLFAFTVEKTHTYPYILQQSARYAHAQKYINELINQFNFSILIQEEITLRQQKGQSVKGYLYLLKKQ